MSQITIKVQTVPLSKNSYYVKMSKDIEAKNDYTKIFELKIQNPKDDSIEDSSQYIKQVKFESISVKKINSKRIL